MQNHGGCLHDNRHRRPGEHGGIQRDRGFAVAQGRGRLCSAHASEIAKLEPHCCISQVSQARDDREISGSQQRTIRAMSVRISCGSRERARILRTFASCRRTWKLGRRFAGYSRFYRPSSPGIGTRNRCAAMPLIPRHGIHYSFLLPKWHSKCCVAPVDLAMRETIGKE